MTHTIIGLFNTADQARQAMQQLLSNGFVRDNVDLSAQQLANAANNNTTARRDTNQDMGDSISNFFSSLFDDKNEAKYYSNEVQNGKSLITIHAKSDDEADRAARLLDQYGAIDVDHNEIKDRSTTNANTAARTNNTNATANKQNDAGVSAKVIEENLEVGKRTVETGGVRLRSRIIKKPVEKHLRLREEHVTVERNPVNRTATDADLKNFKEGEVSVTERAEVPVVNKEARVVEEVSLNKEVNEREKVIQDTVRKTEVDVEKIPAKK